MEQNNNINNEWLNETKIQSEEVKQPADNYIGNLLLIPTQIMIVL